MGDRASLPKRRGGGQGEQDMGAAEKKTTSEGQAVSGPKVEKSLIYPHRSYRIFAVGGKRQMLGEFLLLSLPFIIAVYFLFPLLTLVNCHNAYQLLSTIIPTDFLIIMKQEYMWTHLFLMNLPGSFPSRDFAVINLIVAFALIILAPHTPKLPKSIGIWFAFISLIHLVSAAFFIIMPDRFPYNIQTFSELYVKTEVSMWFIIPLLLSLSMLPLPTTKAKKFFVILFILLLDIILGIVRYVLFLYILNQYSFIYMALMFFAFGPLIDFLYSVVSYCLFVSYIAKEVKEEMELWNWSY